MRPKTGQKPDFGKTNSSSDLNLVFLRLVWILRIIQEIGRKNSDLIRGSIGYNPQNYQMQVYGKHSGSSSLGAIDTNWQISKSFAMKAEGHLVFKAAGKWSATVTFCTGIGWLLPIADIVPTLERPMTIYLSEG